MSKFIQKKCKNGNIYRYYPNGKILTIKPNGSISWRTKNIPKRKK